MVQFTVNGKAVNVAVDDSTPLLYVLRNHLGLKGAKHGCGLGQCGACTVTIDGRPHQSCDVPADFAAGKSVATIEGLGTAEKLHPLQQAFLDEQAGQCGYCLPGILMSAKALLDANPKPARGDIIKALERNLCRCGAHGRILAAIESAAAVMRGESP